MRKLNDSKCLLLVAIFLLVVLHISIAGVKEGKIPITTSSKKALDFYLQERDQPILSLLHLARFDGCNAVFQHLLHRGARGIDHAVFAVAVEL